ncbi:unnamed protein product [Dicrocoelium dendriticum]|nr:unnamed protein product [Dicrocoelium dendriticum]
MHLLRMFQTARRKMFTFLTPFVLFSSLIGFSDADHYSVLGISRSASPAEIKRAFRNLVKNIHPDKNPSIDAHERFMEVNKAYEILSDPTKRAEYDAYGSVLEESQEAHGDHLHASRFVHMPYDQVFDFFSGFSRQTTFSPNILDIDFRSYRLTHLPRSRSVPLLILGYSDFCIPCQRIWPLWSQLADELTAVGVSVAATNLERDGSLRDELRVFHVPSIVMVIDGRVSHYSRSVFTHSSIIDTLRQTLLHSNPSNSKALPSFLSTSLDTPLIQVISSETTFFTDFHFNWRKDSRPRMVLFKPLAVPSLRYVLAAFRAADHMAAGFVNTELQTARALVNIFRLPRDEESLLIFHEDPHKPIYVNSAPKISPADMDWAIRSHSQLSIPRIFSTARLLDLCPTEGNEPKNRYTSASEARTAHQDGGRDGHNFHRHLCLVLLLHSKHTSLEQSDGLADLWLSLLRTVIPDVRARLLQRTYADTLLHHIQPVHVYVDRQSSWLRRLSESVTSGSDISQPKQAGQLILLWRISSTTTAVHMFPSNSDVHPVNLLPISSPQQRDINQSSLISIRMRQALIAELTPILEYLRQIRPGAFAHSSPPSWHVVNNYIVEEDVTDELALPLWLRLRRKLWTWSASLCAWCYDLMSEPLSFVFSTSLIMVGLVLYSLIKLATSAAMEHEPVPMRQQEDTRSNSDSKQSNLGPTDRFRRITPANVVSLNPLTYDRLIVNAPKGHQLFVLCVRGENSTQNSRLCANFASKTAHVVNARVQCALLSLDRYAGWLASLLQHARSGMPVRIRGGPSDPPPGPGTVFINPSNCVGTVLAVNGYRRYFSLYHPVLSDADSSPGSSASGSEEEGAADSHRSSMPSGIRQRRIFARVFGLDSEDEADEAYLNRSSPSGTHRSSSGGVILESELLDGLPNWLDRVFEGSLPRYQLIDWPSSLRGDTFDHLE